MGPLTMLELTSDSNRPNEHYSDGCGGRGDLANQPMVAVPLVLIIPALTLTLLFGVRKVDRPVAHSDPKLFVVGAVILGWAVALWWVAVASTP